MKGRHAGTMASKVSVEHTERVVRFIREMAWERVPAEVQHQARRCLMDALGAMLAGADTPVGEMMTAVAEGQFGGDEATILVSGRRSSASGAVLANGFAGNALDIDDGYRPTKGHPGACALPPVLTAGELAGCSGKAFLSALIIGYELGIRAGLIRHARYETYHSSGSWGAIAGAAAAGKLLGLDDERIREAMGAAEYHAPIAPMMKGIDTPSMGKDSIGWGAMVAMLSVRMAEKGFTGVQPIFDDTPERSWITDLGENFEMMNLYFKPYSACRWGQPAVAGALAIARENDLSPGEIERIEVRTFKEATELSILPPKNTEEAQYNLAFPVAAALLDGEVGPRQTLPPRIFDKDILSLMERVEMIAEDRFQEMFPAKACAEVTVQTKGGKVFRSGIMEANWEPPHTLPTDDEIEQKFRWLTAPVLGAEKTDRLVEMIWRFHTVEDVGELIRACIR